MSDVAASKSPVAQIAISVWTLLLGVLFMMIGNGLQFTLLSIRAIDEGFSSTTTGMISSGYFVGMFGASLMIPSLIERVGHIRVFAALASLASTAILVQSVFVDPWVWTAMRMVTGFSFAGLYVVAESWLNEESSNDNRAQLLSIYLIVQMIGMGMGQVLVNTSDTQRVDLFIAVSILISLSLVPMALSKVAQPAVPASERLGLGELFRISPFGTVGGFIIGMGMASVMGMGAVYGKVVGMSVPEITMFVSAAIVGTVLIQYPLGRLSDLFDRRLVIIFTCFLAGGMALVCDLFLPTTGILSLLGVMIVGGAAVCLYSLILAYLNDFVDRSKIVALCGMYVAVCGLGSVFSPILVGYALDIFGGSGFWWLIATIHLGLGAYGLYRTTQRAPLPSEEQAPFTIVASSTLPLAAEWSEDVYDFTPEETDQDEAADDDDHGSGDDDATGDGEATDYTGSSQTSSPDRSN